MNKLHKFYTSRPWRDLAYSLKVQANGKCNRCQQSIIDWKYLIGHHKTELTEDNVNDPEISLNPDKIEIICQACHNLEHKRFGYNQKVYIVYGPPLSGKSTLVSEISRAGDLILDIDNIWEAVSNQPRYVKPNNLRFNVFRIRDDILEQIRTRTGNWGDAYVIGGYPSKVDRDRLVERLGAELIYCDATEEECMDRAEATGRPSEWKKFIKKWFEEFRE